MLASRWQGTIITNWDDDFVHFSDGQQVAAPYSLAWFCLWRSQPFVRTHDYTSTYLYIFGFGHIGDRHSSWIQPIMTDKFSSLCPIAILTGILPHCWLGHMLCSTTNQFCFSLLWRIFDGTRICGPNRTEWPVFACCLLASCQDTVLCSNHLYSRCFILIYQLCLVIYQRFLKTCPLFLFYSRSIIACKFLAIIHPLSFTLHLIMTLPLSTLPFSLSGVHLQATATTKGPPMSGTWDGNGYRQSRDP